VGDDRVTSRTPSVQLQARALGDPTRHAIFRYLLEAGRPVDVPELTAHLALNHNAIRQHLAKLVAAGLADQRTGPSTGPGRPRLLFSTTPAADDRWGPLGPYERLSVLLADIIRTGGTPVEVGRRAGALRPVADPDDPVAHLREEMARHGFEPDVKVRGLRVDVVLRTCPFTTTVLADADTVCSLHLGLAQGAAAAAGDRLVVDELVAKDPRRAGCRLRCHLEPAQATDDGM
jgi:predicted ArsR family transcriptional regulator